MPIVHKLPTIKIPETTLTTGAPNGTILSVDNLTFSYPDGHTALREISLPIKRGEKVALVGPNGAGKSTLMLHFNGLLQGNGHIQVAGMPVKKENLAFIRAAVGMVFQNPDDQLFSPTVFEDVAFGPLHMGLPEAEVRARVDTALEQVGMKPYAQRLSHHLSSGEKKRISIATVLAMRPKILALDEPSAGLDPRARRSLIELLDQMPLTMVIATHDIRMVDELLPRMVVMDQGRIIADGPTDELLSDQELLETHGLEQP
ncbi:MAG: ABC transporter ATP-binding protein [Chloroflexota bacterium]|nr:ABC transporter ATP-binding protein [Chloroflexota bacterium]